MTTWSPAAPNWPPNIACAVAMASSAVSHDDHALAGGQAVGLDDDRRALPAHPVGVEGLARERRIGRGGNAVALQEFLGEGLGAFELRGGLARPEAAQAGGGEGVDDADHQRAFGADDGEADLLGLGERHEAGDVLGGDVDVAHARLGGGAGVAGRDEHFGNLAATARTSRRARVRARRSRRSGFSSAAV